MEEELTSELNQSLKIGIETLNVTKMDTLVNGALTELEKLRNQSANSTLIFKKIKSNNVSLLHFQILICFITSELNFPYPHDLINTKISHAHRGLK